MVASLPRATGFGRMVRIVPAWASFRRAPGTAADSPPPLMVIGAVPPPIAKVTVGGVGLFPASRESWPPAFTVTDEAPVIRPAAVIRIRPWLTTSGPVNGLG